MDGFRDYKEASNEIKYFYLKQHTCQTVDFNIKMRKLLFKKNTNQSTTTLPKSTIVHQNTTTILPNNTSTTLLENNNENYQENARIEMNMWQALTLLDTLIDESDPGILILSITITLINRYKSFTIDSWIPNGWIYAKKRYLIYFTLDNK